MKKRFTLLLLIVGSLFMNLTQITAQTYCTAGASQCDEYISRVVLGSIDNSTGCGLGSNGTNGYSDYTAQSTSLTPGSSSSISVYNGTYYTSDYADVYIDWNHDGDFTDAGESIGSTNNGSSTTAYTLTVNTPSSPTYFGSTRMRIRMRYGGSANSCGNQTYGEVEDYTVNIPPPASMYFDTLMSSHPDTNDVFISQNLCTIFKSTVRTHNGSYNPIPIDTAWFSIGNTTNYKDIKAIRFFYNYTNPLNLYDTLGTPILPDANGNFMFVFDPGTVLGFGDNSIWIAYDISTTANPNNIIDCELIAARVDDTVRVANQNPAGFRKIVHPSNYNNYCILNRTSGLNYLIGLTRFTMGTIDHQSGVFSNTGNCVDFYTNSIQQVAYQQRYPMRIQHASFNNRDCKLYIDWNNNGFFDNNEMIKYWDNVIAATVIFDTLTIPCDATEGYHRMRFSIDSYYASAPSCGNTTTGEAEDYLIYVSAEDTPMVSFTVPTLNYAGGLINFTPSAVKDGNLGYIWDYDNNSVWDDTTSGDGSYVFQTPGTKTVKLKGVLYGCSDTIESAVFSDTVHVISPTTPPVVNFISNLNAATTSIPITFTDLSTQGPSEWIWEISPDTVNGNPAFWFDPSNTAQEPTVHFNELGSYTVKLTAKNQIGTNSLTKVDYITIVKEQIICTDLTSQSRSGYLYDDGGKYGNYTNSGTGQLYKTCTYRIEPKCATSVTLDFLDFDLCSYGSSGCPNIGGDRILLYDGKNNSGNQLHLNAKDMLGNPIFPDGYTNGSNNAAVLPPSVTATSGTMYIEYQRNCNGLGTGFEAKWSTQLFTPSPPSASIGLLTDTVYSRKAVNFFSLSSGYDLDYAWDVTGDGWSDVFDSSVVYAYPQPGVYNVRLIVQSCDYYDTAYKTIVVIDPTSKPSIDFVADYVRATEIDVINFTDLSDETVYQWEWTITPNTFQYVNGSSTTPDISVKFNAIGKYTVELLGRNALYYDSIVKTDYITVYRNCLPGVANLNNDLGFSEVNVMNLGGDTLIHNTSSIGLHGYTDYSKTIETTLYKTGNYTLNTDRFTNFNSITRTAWIDFNQNGEYENSEKVAEEKNSSNLGWTVSFTVPATAFEGKTKLRLAANAGILDNKGCGPNYSGEYEDYGIIISPDNVVPFITLLGQDSMPGGDTIILNACEQYVEPGYRAWDDVSGDLTANVTVVGATAINPLVPAYYTITYDVDDNANNSATQATRVVQVLPDIVAPDIALIGNNPDYVAVFGTYTDPGFTVSDFCSGVKASSTVGTVNTSVVGEYTLWYISEDKANNKDSISRTVYVYDSVNPTISLIGSDTIYLEVLTSFNDPGASPSDNYYTNLNYTTSGIVDITKLGAYFLSYCVTDPSGNGPVCVDRLVIVQDKTGPTLSTNQTEFTMDVFSGWTDPEPIKKDNYWPEENIVVTKTGSVNTLELGTYYLYYVAVDASGNVSPTLTITVNVVDRTAPTIELLGQSLVTILRWTEFTDPGVTVKDNYYDKTKINIVTGGTYEDSSSFQIGLYSITYKACDPDNNCSQEVTRFVYVDQNISIDETNLTEAISFYPNPVKDQLNINIDMNSYQNLTLSVYNSLGENVMEVYNGFVKSTQLNVNVSNLASGMYYLRISDNKDNLFNKKFLIAR